MISPKRRLPVSRISAARSIQAARSAIVLFRYAAYASAERLSFCAIPASSSASNVFMVRPVAGLMLAIGMMVLSRCLTGPARPGSLSEELDERSKVGHFEIRAGRRLRGRCAASRFARPPVHPDARHAARLRRPRVVVEALRSVEDLPGREAEPLDGGLE